MQGGCCSECIGVVGEYFRVLDVRYTGSPRGEFADILLGEPLRGLGDDVKEEMYARLVSNGCYPILRNDSSGVILRIVSSSGHNTSALKYIVLAILTIASVYYSGIGLSHASGNVQGLAWSPLGYVIGLLLPLLVHEAGHYIAMRRYNVPASIPMLIPAPPLQLGFLGTFGAVINMRWIPPTRGSLALVAVMGPLAGFIAALPFAIIGIKSSLVVESLAQANGVPLTLVPAIVIILTELVYPDAGSIVFSPMAFASYVVFLVTFLNLIPVSMLDGGHIVRSLMDEDSHRKLSMTVTGIFIVASIINPAFTMFALIALIILALTRGRHPGAALEPGGEPGMTRKLVASLILYGLLVALTLPIPVG